MPGPESSSVPSRSSRTTGSGRTPPSLPDRGCPPFGRSRSGRLISTDPSVDWSGMTRRRRLARRLALAGAVAVAIALVAGVAWSTTRDTVIAVGTASAWPAQEAEIEQALDRVDLPASFAPIACRDLPDGYVRC